MADSDQVRSRAASSRRRDSLSRLGDSPVSPRSSSSPNRQGVTGPDVRVHVVGDLAFAERIDFTGGVDARYSPRATRQFRAVDLPDDIRGRCLDLVARSGLWIVGIDFKLDRESSEYVALEANPTPGYDVYDYRLGGRISEALLRLMAEGAPTRQPPV